MKRTQATDVYITHKLISKSAKCSIGSKENLNTHIKAIRNAEMNLQVNAKLINIYGTIINCIPRD